MWQFGETSVFFVYKLKNLIPYFFFFSQSFQFNFFSFNSLKSEIKTFFFISNFYKFESGQSWLLYMSLERMFDAFFPVIYTSLQRSPFFCVYIATTSLISQYSRISLNNNDEIGHFRIKKVLFLV